VPPQRQHYLKTQPWLICERDCFQKKAKTGIKTPKPEIDLIRARLKRLKEVLK
jgi:phage-related protein